MRLLLPAGVAALLVGMVGMVGTVALSAGGHPPPGMGMGGTLMSSGMRDDPGKMMGSMMSGIAPGHVSAEQARLLGDSGPTGAKLDRASKRITFETTDIQLAVLASPEGGPDMTFRIGGLANPTILIPRGARVTIQLINGDSDTSHGWELISGQGGLSSMPMMGAGPVFPGSFGMPLGSPSSSGWPAEILTFTAATTGSYTYICPVPGHTQKGMRGQLVVS